MGLMIRFCRVCRFCFCVFFFSLIVSSFSVHAALTSQESARLRVLEEHYSGSDSAQLSITPVLGDFVQYALLNSAQLKAAFYAWQRAVEDVDIQHSFADPQLSFKQYIKEVETRVGPQKQMYALSQTFPFPGKRMLRGDVATDRAREAYAAYQKTELRVIFEVKKTYYEYWYLTKALSVTEVNQDLLNRFEELIQSKFKAGVGNNQDLLKAQIEQGKNANELLRYREYLIPIEERLRAVANVPASYTFTYPDVLDHAIVPLDEEALRAMVQDRNPDLAQAGERVHASEKKVGLAKLNFFPDVTVGADYVNVENGPLSPGDNGNDVVAVTVKVNVPLWIDKQVSVLEGARAESHAAKETKKQLERDILSRFSLLLFSLRDGERRIRLYRDALLPKAEQAVALAETGYRSGGTDFLNLIEFERQLMNFRLSYYRAVCDYEQTLAELEMIIGEPIKKEGVA